MGLQDWREGAISSLSPPLPTVASLSVGHFPYLPALFYHGSHNIVDSAASVALDLFKNNRLSNFLAPQVFSHCCDAQK